MPRVKNIKDIRRENTVRLIKETFDGSQAKFAKAMSFENPSFVSRLLSTTAGTSKNIGDKLARKIETIAGKPENWLDVEHNGPQPELGIEQRRNDYNVIAGPDVRRSVPLISQVQAGQWREVIDNLQPGDAERWVPTTARVGAHAYALRVRGDSMTNPNGSPSFPEGTTIILDPEVEAQPGNFVVVRQAHDAEVTFKQLVKDGARWYLKPLNPRYPILELAADATICGVLRQAVLDF